MKTLLFSTILILATALVGCQQSDNSAPATSAPAASPQATASQAASNTITGTVAETMNAQGYTYVLVDTGTEQIWAATAQFQVSEGDMVVVPEGMPMHNYTSPSLQREFDVVYFVESILNASHSTEAPTEAAQMPQGHPPMGAAASAPQIDLSDVNKVEGGMTIGEIYADKENLNATQVSLRGKVVKFSPQIMGTNWIHLQDGTGDAAEGTHDLTITSDAQLQVGDIVVATGAVTVDKDFGHGYFYSLILENATVTVE